jgi:hypothetical protein
MSNGSTQNIPQEATKLKKLSKVTARYMEMEEFKDSSSYWIFLLQLHIFYETKSLCYGYR